MIDTKTNTQQNSTTSKNITKRSPLPDAEYNRTWDQEKNYKFIKRFIDPRFSEISVVKNPTTNHVLLCKEKMVSGKNEATDDIENLKSRLSINHPNMMRMVDYSTSVKKELCSTHYLSRGFYEFPKTDVQKEIVDRKKVLTDFNDRELTHMLYQVAFALQNLHSKNMTHGDVRPQLIGYDKATNSFQLLDRFADPTPLEKCQSNNIINNKDLFLSPQLYKKLKVADRTATYNAQKNDMYALGITVLHTGTMDSMQDNYLPNGTINTKQLGAHLQDFDNKYGQRNPLLCQTVRALLTEDEVQRPDANQFISSLPPYDQFRQMEAQGGTFGTARPFLRNEPRFDQGNAMNTDTFDFFGGQQGYGQAQKVQNTPAFEYKNKKFDEESNRYIIEGNQNQQRYGYGPNYGQSTPQIQSYNMTSNNPTRVYATPETYNSGLSNQQGPGFNQPSQKYVHSSPQDYTYYQFGSQNQGHGQSTYQPQSGVQQNYLNKEPQTITYTRPITTDINTHHASNISYAQPTQYVSNTSYTQPTQHFVSTPVQYADYSYVSDRKVESIPNTIYVSTQDNMTSGSKIRYSHSYTDSSRLDQTNDRILGYRSNAIPTEVYTTQYANTQYMPAEKTVETRIIRDAPTTVMQSNLSYTNPENRVYTTVPETRTQTRVSYATPDNRVYTSIPETRISRQSYSHPETKVYSTIPETRVIGNTYNANYLTNTDQPGYVTEQRRSIRFLNSEQVHKVPTNYSTDRVEYRDAGNLKTTTLGNNVEIRRGTYTMPTETTGTVIKKKYVMKDDGTVIEVDDNSFNVGGNYRQQF